MSHSLKVSKCPNEELAQKNKIYVCKDILSKLTSNRIIN